MRLSSVVSPSSLTLRHPSTSLKRFGTEHQEPTDKTEKEVRPPSSSTTEAPLKRGTQAPDSLESLHIKKHPSIQIFQHDTPASHYELKNGLHVLLARDTRLPVVNVSDCVGVGTRHELNTQQGMAHFLEHLVADGEADANKKQKVAATLPHATVPKAFDFLRRKGLDTNAMTSQDWTRYYTHDIPKVHLHDVLKAHASRLIASAPFEAKDVIRERGVISEEIRLHQDTVEKKAQHAVGRGVFRNTPYEHHPLGSQKDIKTFTPEALAQFYKTHYHPSNRMLVISGDIPPDHELLPIIHTLYDGQWQPLSEKRQAPVSNLHPSLHIKPLSSNSTQTKPDTPLGTSQKESDEVLFNYPAYPKKPDVFYNPRSKETAQAVSGARILWQSREARQLPPHELDPKDIYQNIASHMLNGMWQPESLVKHWVYKTQALDDLDIELGQKHFAEAIGITAETHKPRQLFEQLHNIKKTLYRQVHQGKLPSTRSIEAAKIAIKDDIATLKESPSGKHNLLEGIAHGWLEYHSGVFLPKEGESIEGQYRKALSAVTPEGVQKWLKQRVPKPDAWYTIALLPEKKGNRLPALELPRFFSLSSAKKASKVNHPTEAPVQDAEVKKPLASRFGGKLPNNTLTIDAPHGGEWLLKQDPFAPKVGMSVILKHNHVTPWQSDKNFQPYAHVLTGLYQLGVAGESSEGFQQFVDEHGLSYGVNVLPSHLNIHVSGLPEKVPEMTRLMQKLLLQGPIRDPKLLQQTKQNTYNVLDMLQSGRTAEGNEYLRLSLHPTTDTHHPLTEPQAHIKKAVAQFTPAMVSKLLQPYQHQQSHTLTVTGPVDKTQLTDIAQATVLKLPVKSHPNQRATLNIKQDTLASFANNDLDDQVILQRQWLLPAAKDNQTRLLRHLAPMYLNLTLLYEAFRNDESQLGYATYMKSHKSGQNQDRWVIASHTSKDKLKESTHTLQNALDSLAEKPIQIETLVGCIDQLITGLKESTLSQSGLAQSIATHRHGGTPSPEETIEQLEHMKQHPEETAKAFQAMLVQAFNKPSQSVITANQSVLDTLQLKPLVAPWKLSPKSLQNQATPIRWHHTEKQEGSSSTKAPKPSLETFAWHPLAT
jgi:predicted Zn-dependent peptidase